MSRFVNLDDDPNNQSDAEIGQPIAHQYPTIYPSNNIQAPLNIQQYAIPAGVVQNQPFEQDYNLVRAKSKYHKWEKYVKWIGLIVISFGILFVIGDLISLFNLQEYKITVDGPSEIREFTYPQSPLIFNRILDLVKSILQCVIGFKLNEVLNGPSRRSTWKAHKFILIFALFYLLLMVLQAYAQSVAAEKAYQKWTAIKYKPAGAYDFKDDLLDNRKSLANNLL